MSGRSHGVAKVMHDRPHISPTGHLHLQYERSRCPVIFGRLFWFINHSGVLLYAPQSLLQRLPLFFRKDLFRVSEAMVTPKPLFNLEGVDGDGPLLDFPR
jgi:hypothetical protein